MFSFSKLWILWLRSWTDFSIVWPKPNDAPPTLVGFSVIIFIVFTIAWTRKRSVFTSFVKFKTERGSWWLRRSCSCSSKKKRLLSSLCSSSPCALLVFEFFKGRLRMYVFFWQICEFSKLIYVSQVLSEPNVCCKITETSVLSKVTFIRLSENTDFFSEGKRLAILTIFHKIWNGSAWRLTFQQSSNL